MARTLDLTWRPRPHQVVPQVSDAVTYIAIAGRGTGKTWNATRWLLTQALTYPNTTWVAVGRTWSEAQRILAEGEGGLRWHILGDAERPNLEWTLTGGQWEAAFTRSPGRMELRFANGSVIRFASADRPNSLRGTNAHGAVADEVAFWDEEAWHMLRLAVRLPLPDGSPARIFAATTPNGMGWAYQEFLDPEKLPKPGVAFVGGASGGHLPPDPPPSTFDNPHTDPIWRAQLISMYEGTELGRQEIYGEVLALTGAVYKGLSLIRHTRSGLDGQGLDWPTPDTADEVIAGQDLGSENPSALVVLARLGDRWHVVAEVYAPAATEDDWHRMIGPTLEEWRPTRIYSDRNYPQTTTAQTRRGLPIVLADKGDGSVLDGIRTVQQFLSADRLALDVDGVPNTNREFRTYRWATRPDGSPLTPERPVKKDDHALDALRYALFMHVGRPKRSLRIAG